ncbi:hypothetical protein MKK88_05705 [Methylobacterium sp. E-005]|uniref:hypothetical protein n=1 Tax=Methylobacterium sp. E-005 TaxID=2836549 RepID=UPI001FB9AC46|nr:hypothetical protein [Methylobacterium sp. E-005]MCJ2085489.1 hypothetical protein [Methylobacterium sp. E-005]
MSFLSSMLTFLVKEAPHAAEDLQTLNSLTKQIRDLINKHPTNTREGFATLTALETVAQQGFQFLAAHSSMVAAPGKSATPAKKS